MERTRGFLLLLAALLAGEPARADESLWKRLATEPNLVVLMRHTQNTSGKLLAWDPTGNCEGEVVLTGRGRSHAKRIGEEFERRGVKPGAVISSPMCRCRETARIAFGADGAMDPALRETASADSARASESDAVASRLIAQKRGPGPVVFVSHQPNINQITMELIADGDLLVARADEKGALDVLGKLRVAP